MTASRKIEEFIVHDLSTWYIRRSRNRVGAGKSGDEENVLTIWNQQIDKVISWLSHKLEWFEVHAKKRNDEEKNLLEIGDRQIDKVISWLSQKDEKEPFFLWLHLFDVHEAWTLRNIKGKPPAFHSRFRDDTFRRYIQEVYQPSSKYLQSRKYWKMIDKYDEQIRFVDTQIERLFDWLKENRPDEPMLWIITSDHGEGLGNHNYKGHGKYIYQEQLKVPLIFYFTDQNDGGRRIDDLVGTIDLLPTLADYVGGSLDKALMTVQGLSLRPLIENEMQGFNARYAFSQRPYADFGEQEKTRKRHERYALHDLNYKYIFNTDKKDEFYDLEINNTSTDGINLN